MRALLVSSILSLAVLLPARTATAAPITSATGPSRSDVCKSLGSTNGNVPYSRGEYHWACGPIDYTSNVFGLTVNLGCKLDPRKKWGYWVRSGKATASLYEWSVQKQHAAVFIVTTSSKKVWVRGWVSCLGSGS
ncbi:MAG: hypothetical protein NVSMB52_21190 [Chloroflexota bacterium]